VTLAHCVVDNILFVYVRMIQSGLRQATAADHPACERAGVDGGAGQAVIDHVVIAAQIVGSSSGGGTQS